MKRRGTPGQPRELAHHDCIAWSGLGSLNTWWLQERGADKAFPIRTRLATTSAESASAAACSGLGLTQTTCYEAEQGVREGRLKIVLRECECAVTPVSLVHSSHRLVPLKLRAFIDFAAPRLSERLKSSASVIDAAPAAV